MSDNDESSLPESWASTPPDADADADAIDEADDDEEEAGRTEEEAAAMIAAGVCTSPGTGTRATVAVAVWLSGATGERERTGVGWEGRTNRKTTNKQEKKKQILPCLRFFVLQLVHNFGTRNRLLFAEERKNSSSVTKLEKTQPTHEWYVTTKLHKSRERRQTTALLSFQVCLSAPPLPRFPHHSK